MRGMRILSVRNPLLAAVVICVMAFAITACQNDGDDSSGSHRDGGGLSSNDAESDSNTSTDVSDNDVAESDAADSDAEKSDPLAVLCDAACDKFATCDIEGYTCVQDCRAELDPWGALPLETWGSCVEQASCAELGTSAEAAAQTCYERLPLTDQRTERCQLLVSTAEECGQDTGYTSQLQVECVYFARTSGANWSATDSCAQAANDGSCEETVTCANQVFDLQTE